MNKSAFAGWSAVAAKLLLATATWWKRLRTVHHLSGEATTATTTAYRHAEERRCLREAKWLPRSCHLRRAPLAPSSWALLHEVHAAAIRFLKQRC